MIRTMYRSVLNLTEGKSLKELLEIYANMETEFMKAERIRDEHTADDLHERLDQISDIIISSALKEFGIQRADANEYVIKEKEI